MSGPVGSDTLFVVGITCDDGPRVHRIEPAGSVVCDSASFVGDHREAAGGLGSAHAGLRPGRRPPVAPAALGADLGAGRRTRGPGRTTEVLAPEPADDETLGRYPHPGYIAAVREASEALPGCGRARSRHRRQPGLPRHARQRRADRRRFDRRRRRRSPAARSTGRSTSAAACTTRWPTTPPASASTTTPRWPSRRCSTRAIRRVAYVDVDVHHGDGVQAAFYDDPRVLTVSIHESPLTLFPGTGWPAELGSGAAQGTVGERRAAGRHVGCRLAAGLSRGGARRGRRPSGRRCWSPSTAPTRTGRTRWPT